MQYTVIFKALKHIIMIKTFNTQYKRDTFGDLALVHCSLPNFELPEHNGVYKLIFKECKPTYFRSYHFSRILSPWTFSQRHIFTDCRNGLNVCKNTIKYVFMDIFAAIYFRDFFFSAKIYKINCSRK